MSVRFASTNHPGRRLGWRAAGRGLIAPVLARAANDNGYGDAPCTAGCTAGARQPNGAKADAVLQPARFDLLLVDALRHFAVHGLAAAVAARDAAHEAGGRGDDDAKDHWMAIARMFDRRLAARPKRELSPA